MEPWTCLFADDCSAARDFRPRSRICQLRGRGLSRLRSPGSSTSNQSKYRSWPGWVGKTEEECTSAHRATWSSADCSSLVLMDSGMSGMIWRCSSDFPGLRGHGSFYKAIGYFIWGHWIILHSDRVHSGGTWESCWASRAIVFLSRFRNSWMNLARLFPIMKSSIYLSIGLSVRCSVPVMCDFPMTCQDSPACSEAVPEKQGHDVSSPDPQDFPGFRQLSLIIAPPFKRSQLSSFQTSPRL